MKTRLISTFVLILGGSLPATAQVGPEIRNPATGHFYRELYIPSPIPMPLWDYYEALAQSLGGHLVTINDAAENQWLLDTFCAGFCDPHRYIGLVDTEFEGVYQWVSGEPVTYFNWAPDEPNNAFGNEDYAEMWEDGTWNDIGPDDPTSVNGAFMERIFALRIQSNATSYAEAGGTVNFAVQSLVGGLGGITYQWFKNGQPIPGGDMVGLAIANISAADSGSYHCEATDEQLATTPSNAITMTVVPIGALPLTATTFLLTFAAVVLVALLRRTAGSLPPV